MRKVEPSELRMQLLDDGTIRPVGCRCKCPGCPSLSFGNPIPNVPDYVRNESSPTHQSYKSMKTRVFNPNHDSYKYYGGKGVDICLFWIYKFRYFVRDLGVRPEGTTLDRIDTDGDYTPYNCKWSDLKTQANNRKNTDRDGGITPLFPFDENKPKSRETVVCYREDLERLIELANKLALALEDRVALKPQE